MTSMIKKIAWETFKNTGDINSFMELKQIENIEKEIENMKKTNIDEKIRDKYGEFKDQWNCIIRK